jgi:hypothetical protein
MESDAVSVEKFIDVTVCVFRPGRESKQQANYSLA